MLRIALTGGGTGGHVFPLVAVADELKKLGGDRIALRYYGPKSEWNAALAERGIPVSHVAGAKLRRYASLQNFLDVPKFFWGLLEALVKLYFWMPDAVFSKGGPGALPVVLAAAWYWIPVVIHESDAAPGLTNRVSARFARRIGVGFEAAATLFSAKKTFVSGNPVRAAIAEGVRGGKKTARALLGTELDLPLLLVLGGSQGAKTLNDFVVAALPALTEFVEAWHQTGKNGAGIEGTPRYHMKEFLNEREMATVLAAADLVLTRAGGSAIFECAAAGVPAILVPLERGANRHQHANAAAYAAAGAAIVLTEENLTPNLATEEIKKLLADEEKRKAMGERARVFYRSDAAETIAKEVLGIAGAKVVEK